MTVKEAVQRAALRAMMAAPMRGMPDYWADPDVLRRVGSVIGDTASDEERHVRPSDGISGSTSKVTPPAQRNIGRAMWLWSVVTGTALCTVGLLAVLYWHFG